MPRKTSTECSNCRTTYNHSIDVEVPVVRCFYPGCPVELCPSCDKFACDGCGHSFCIDHRIKFQGLQLCIGCLQEALEANEPQCLCQTNGDLFDPRGCCDLHDSRSEYNVLRRQVTAVEQYQKVKGEVA